MEPASPVTHNLATFKDNSPQLRAGHVRASATYRDEEQARDWRRAKTGTGSFVGSSVTQLSYHSGHTVLSPMGKEATTMGPNVSQHGRDLDNLQSAMRAESVARSKRRLPGHPAEHGPKHDLTEQTRFRWLSADEVADAQAFPTFTPWHNHVEMPRHSGPSRTGGRRYARVEPQVPPIEWAPFRGK